MKSLLIAAALAFAAVPTTSIASHADALIITNHDHDSDHLVPDTDIHTGAVVTVHKDEGQMRTEDGCTTKTVQKSNDEKTVTKTKKVCH